MRITPEMYSKMSDNASPPSRSKVNIPVAFVVGGIICVIGQFLMTAYKNMGMDSTSAGAWTSITLVAASSLCTGMGWYQKLAKHAGAGTLVPITGFSNAVTSAAVESSTEGYVTGVGTKIFTIAGPVILYGCTASVIYGVVYYLFNGG
ncbi:MAG: SpoVA protein [Firmicutes bacterium ADurb.BinA205]|nr:MAG: SpoVA protein [Firmicutes bacterium ADurb.BinA205]